MNHTRTNCPDWNSLHIMEGRFRVSFYFNMYTCRVEILGWIKFINLHKVKHRVIRLACMSVTFGFLNEILLILRHFIFFWHSFSMYITHHYRNKDWMNFYIFVIRLNILYNTPVLTEYAFTLFNSSNGLMQFMI